LITKKIKTTNTTEEKRDIPRGLKEEIWKAHLSEGHLDEKDKVKGSLRGKVH